MFSSLVNDNESTIMDLHIPPLMRVFFISISCILYVSHRCFTFNWNVEEIGKTCFHISQQFFLIRTFYNILGHIREPLENKEIDCNVRECEGNDYIQSSSSTSSSSSSLSSSSSSSSMSSDNELDSDDSVADKHYIPDYEEDTDSANDDQPSENITVSAEVEVATVMNESPNVGAEVAAVLDENQNAIGEIGIDENVPILVSPSKKRIKEKGVS